METWLFNLLVFLAIFFAVFAANALLLDLGAGQRRRLNEELQDQLRHRERDRVKLQDFSQIAQMANRPKMSFLQSLDALLDQSGLGISVGRVLLWSVGAAVLAGLLCGSITRSPLLASMATAAGGALPWLYVLSARHQRLEKLLAQLPDAFDLMSRVLRSGQTISQAMKMVSEQFSAPLSVEFFRCHEQINLGLPADAALHDLARRIGLLEIKIFAVAVLVQRQTGGNLSELFDKMGTLVRERFRIRGLIQSLTAQGRMQAAILLSLPVAMFVLLMAVKPDYEMVLFEHPMLIVVTLALMGVGALWIHRIMHFDY